mgnify:CR=1 FL=1
MIKIGLFCAAGMSTSMLVGKMTKAAKDKELDVAVNAYPESNLSHILDEGIDVVLLGPQVKFKLPSLQSLCDTKGVPIAVIDPVDYGMMDGDKVLSDALALIESKV